MFFPAVFLSATVLAVMAMALLGQDIVGGEWLFGGYEAKVAAYVLVLAGSVQRLGECAGERYDRPGGSRLGDHGWGWCCSWSKRGPTARRAVSR